MRLTIDIQVACERPCPPSDRLRRWVAAALDGRPAELCLRIVDEDEITDLNARYRHIRRPTNVLSFPFDAPEGVAPDFLGDVVISAPVVAREAAVQRKPEEAHWAHMVVHGVLHLCGFDHGTPADAEVMEERERTILSRLGFQDPYLRGENHSP